MSHKKNLYRFIDNPEDIQMAHSILKEDQEELETLIKEANQKKEFNLYLKVAIKANEIADLYFEALEGFSDPFFKNKKLAAQYYDILAKKFNYEPAWIFTILLAIHSNDLKKALKKFSELKKTLKKRQKRKEEKSVVDKHILDLIKKVLEWCEKQKEPMDSMLSYLEKEKLNSDIKELVPILKKTIYYYSLLKKAS